MKKLLTPLAATALMATAIAPAFAEDMHATGTARTGATAGTSSLAKPNGASAGANVNADTRGLEATLPAGKAQYRYYTTANVYRGADNRYYYVREGKWVSSMNAPTGIKLDAKPTTVQLEGKAHGSGAGLNGDYNNN